MRIQNTSPMLLLSAALVFVTGCQQQAGQATSPGGSRVEKQEIVDKRTAVLQEAEKKRQARTQELKSMDVPRLARELETDSQKGVEPFNSLAFAEMVARGKDAAGTLAPLITKADRSSLFGLLALRKIGPEQFGQLKPDLRVNILVDALRTSKYFNTWGLPHLSWEEAAKAIIAEGQAAERPLTALLSDKRPAPVWGSEGYAEYQRYQYRVCDYAWALLNEIHGQKVPIPEDPAARDRLKAGTGKPG
ncbi:MAG TPA: hypothetical protein VHE60_09605 [Pyrinomonadaceae bacterium]|nr:hypothetical protein [Pyrinomonadaceae bacterium]